VKFKNIVFVVNNPEYFVSHRLPIGLELIKQGCVVHLIAPGICPKQLIQYGFIYHNIKMSRKGKNLLNEFLIIWSLTKLFIRIKPDLIHLVTIKPYLYGGIAARIAGVHAVVSAVAGLGSLFSNKTYKLKILRHMLYPIYRLAFNHNNQITIFQNTNDRDTLLSWGVIDKANCVIIRGAGLDLSEYPIKNEPIGIPVISFAGRLLLDKGVKEFVEASTLLKARGIEADFWLIGSPDFGNDNTITHQQLNEWHNARIINYLGYRSDIAKLFSKSNIVCLPSYYGEGLPKVLIEAAASGRAVITTDHPGCRDAIEPYKTGLLVPVKDALALADAIQDLICNTDKRKYMGIAGRALAEREFTIEKIVSEHIRIYSSLTNQVNQ